VTKRLVLAASVLLASCGGAATQGTIPPPTAAGEEVLSGLCSGVVAAGLGEGTLCADSGFRIDTDRFTFANWGRSDSADENVTVQTLIDMFGHSQVCMAGPVTECVLRPRAAQALHDWNVALSGGRCEGLAVLSQRIHLDYDRPAEFDGGWSTTSEIPRTARGLPATIVHWWATQFVPEVAREAASSRAKDPATLVAELISGLANRAGHTIGIYQRGSGHSLTPFAVTRRGDTWVVHVYDNNDPRERRELHVRPADGTWTYEGPNETWTGTTGTLELTPMWVRNVPFSCPFCSGDTGTTTVTVSSPDGAPSAFVAIDADAAGTIEQTSRGFTNTVDGASVEPTKGSSGDSVTVRVPASVTVLRIELRGTEGVPHPGATVTVRRPGHPDVQVRGVLPAAPSGAARVTSPVISTSAGSTTVGTNTGTVQVVLAGDSNLGTLVLAAGDELEVSRLRASAGSPATADVSLRGDAVDSRLTVEFSPDSPTDTEMTVKNGVLTATASPSASLRVSPARRMRNAPVPRDDGTTTTVGDGTVPSVDVTLPG